MRVRYTLMPLWIGVMASSCLSESHAPGDPLELERFCDTFFDAVCAPLEDCGCGAAVLAECRAEERALCADFPSAALVLAIEEGRVVYDPVEADALITRLRGRGCEGFVVSLDWRVRDLFDLGGTFVGTGTAGADCTGLGFELISECATGSCVPSGDAHVCRASVDEGATCDATHQCVDLDAMLQTGGSIDRLVLRCDEDAGACRRWIPEGEACGAPGECWTGQCVADACASIPPDGACLSSRECAAGHYCSSLRCVPGGAPDGAPCDDDAACASLVCTGSVCRPAGCDLF